MELTLPNEMKEAQKEEMCVQKRREEAKQNSNKRRFTLFKCKQRMKKQT